MQCGCVQDIEDAIMNSGLGFNPSNDGAIIRINVPQLTEERRAEMVKLANSEAENAKVRSSHPHVPSVST